MENKPKKQKGKINTQISINQKSMLCLSAFMDYCQNNGLDIKKENLEKLHKQGMVFPALKVYRGIMEYRKIYATIHGRTNWYYVYPEDLEKFKAMKIDKKKYYRVCGISKYKDKWLDYYFENEMVEFPSQKRFSSWNIKSYPDFYTDWKKINKEYEFIYDKGQMLAIKIALPYSRFLEQLNPKAKKETIKYIQTRIAELYKFLELYYEAECLFDAFEKDKQEKYNNLKKELHKKPTKLEWNQEYDFEVFPKYKELTEQLIKKHRADLNFIHRWRHFLAGKCLINESGRSSKIRSAYIKSLDNDMILGLDEMHYMIYVINRLLYLLTGKEENVKEVLGGFLGKTCPICKSTFDPRNKEQITCGNPKCVKDHKNILKRKKRRTDRIITT